MLCRNGETGAVWIKRKKPFAVRYHGTQRFRTLNTQRAHPAGGCSVSITFFYSESSWVRLKINTP